MSRLELLCIDRHLVAEGVGSGYRDRAAQDTGVAEPDRARKRRVCGGGLAVPIRASSSQEEKKALISDGGGRMDGKEGGWLADGRLCQCRTRGEALLTAIKAAVGLGGTRPRARHARREVLGSKGQTVARHEQKMAEKKERHEHGHGGVRERHPRKGRRAQRRLSGLRAQEGGLS